MVLMAVMVLIASAPPCLCAEHACLRLLAQGEWLLQAAAASGLGRQVTSC
jgi:hypothetical protein